MSNNLFSIIIPTMWKSEHLKKMLKLYQKSKYVYEIILIDNDPKNKFDLSNNHKILYYSENKNIYVNPAWNIGYTLSSKKIILANDDILINNIDEVFELFLNSYYDIVGMSLESDNYGFRIDTITNFPAKSYGCFMFVKNYIYIPEKYKIWYGDQFLFESSEKKGILKNANITANVSETLNSNKQELRKTVALIDTQIYNREGFNINPPVNNKKVLAVLVNYGDEQLNFLKKVVNELKNFKKYEVTIIVNSNINIIDSNIDKVNVYNLDNYELLPLTCRSVIIDNLNHYDVFIYGENDHLFKEYHLDKHIEYSEILPENRISGLIQYEENEVGKFYPAYHGNYEWDFNNVEIYDNKKFAHFTNVHQASFILTKKQLQKISKKHDFKSFFGKSKYSVKCKVNTDIYDFCDMKKMICISEFKDNLIHHLPNLYIDGKNGRNKNQRSDNVKMNNSLIRLLGGVTNKIICGIATTLHRKESLRDTVNSIIDQVDELIVYQNGYYNFFDFLKNEKIKLFSSLNTGINMGDAGKFYLADKYPNCYYLSIDDDIIYPKDYVSSIIDGINKFNKTMVVTHHGKFFDKKPKNYYSDYFKSYHYRQSNKDYNIVNFPGTGVMGFYTGNISISFSDFKHPNIADIIVGVKMSKNNIKCVCLPHKENWIIDSIKYDQNNTLFNTNKKNDIIKVYLDENFVVRNYEISLIKKLSIIIPTYKNVQFLPECFESILKSIKNLDCEVLVGIDNCQDTLNYIKNNIFDSRFKFFLFEKNVGPYVIKNTLTNLSESNKILFFDSDDIMTEDLIPNVIDGLNTHKVYRPMYVDFIDGTKIRPFNKLKTNHFGYGVIGIDKDTFLSLNGFEGWRCEADNDFLNRLNNTKKSILHGSSISFLRRIHKNGLTSHPNTNYKSQLREQYRKLSAKHRPNGKCEKFETGNFIEVKVNGFENDKKDIFELKREEKKKLLNSVIPQVKKENNINYDLINTVLNKDNGPTTKSKVKEPVQNLPKERKEILEKKKESNYEIVKKLLSDNPRKKHKYPDIEPFKKKN